MTNFAQVELNFASALLGAQKAPESMRGGELRFSIYRNNVAMNLIGALASRYPVVKRLVGDEFFCEMARQHVVKHPPRSPILLYYGDEFPSFIDGFEQVSAIPYLGGVARIELARGLAYHAADVEVLGTSDFASLDLGSIESIRVLLHPSVSIVPSDFPAYSIWKVNQSRAPVVPVSPWAPETTLISRPLNAVRVRKLEGGQAVFLQNLARGNSLGNAVSAGLENEKDFDPAKALAMLIESRIVSRFSKKEFRG
jgi:hypothetical protein